MSSTTLNTPSTFVVVVVVAPVVYGIGVLDVGVVAGVVVVVVVAAFFVVSEPKQQNEKRDDQQAAKRWRFNLPWMNYTSGSVSC